MRTIVSVRLAGALVSALAVAALTACEVDELLGARLPGSWGEFAAELDVPQCAPGFELLVDTTADELEVAGGLADPADVGAALSLREALHIASNRAGPTSIRFDPEVFPARTPGVIEMGCELQSPNVIAEACIDARDRGVIVRWPAEVDCPRVPSFNGGLIVGLTLERIPGNLRISSAQLAGNRLDTDGGQVLEGTSGLFDVAAGGPDNVVGPGNVFTGHWGVTVGPGTAVITGNYFGVDPVSGAVLGVQNAIELGSIAGPTSATIEDNVFAVSGDLIWDATADAEATLRDNFVGVDREGALLPGEWRGISGLTAGRFVVGPGNLIRGTDAAISVGGYNQDDGLRVRVTQNQIFDNGAGIVADDPSRLPAPPTIATSSASGASGGCAVAGTVELFSDRGDQGEEFEGEAACDPATGWAIAADLPLDRNFTATLTDGNGRTSPFSSPTGG
jgi:hypothetical protein